jgi:ABC-type Fe3+/spermidine/putrescine transport system ATPase subunit
MGAVNWINGIGVRPEATKVERTPWASGERSCRATVTGVVFLGNCVHVRTRLPSGEEAVAELHGQSPAFHVGETVHLCWDPAHEMSLA